MNNKLVPFCRLARSAAGVITPGAMVVLLFDDGTPARVFSDAMGLVPRSSHVMAANASGMVWGYLAPGSYVMQVTPAGGPTVVVPLELGRTVGAAATPTATVAGAGSSVFARNWASYQMGSIARVAGVLQITLIEDCPWPSRTPVFVGAEACYCHGELRRLGPRTFEVDSPGLAFGPVNNPGRISSQVHYTDCSWFARVQAAFGGAFEVMGWPSRGGDIPAQSELRQPELLSLGADIILLDPSMGNAILEGLEQDDHWPSVKSQVLRAQASGALVLIPNIKPKDLVRGGTNPGQTTAWLRANERLHRWLSRLTNVHVVDVFNSMLDPTHPEGGSKPNRHADAVHLNAAGAADYAAPFVTVLQRYVQPRKLGRNGMVDSFGQTGGRQVWSGLRSLVGQAQAGTGVSGLWDAGVALTGQGGGTRTAVGQLVAGANGAVSQVMVLGGGNGDIWTARFRGSATERMKDRVSAGRRFRASVVGSISAIGGLVAAIELLAVAKMADGTELSVAAARTQSGSVEKWETEQDVTSHAQTAPESQGWVFEPFWIPDGAMNDFDVRFNVMFGASGSTVTIQVDDLSVWEITGDFE